jgi:hypothetical protein
MSTLVHKVAFISGLLSISAVAMADTVVYNGGTGNLVSALTYGNTAHPPASVSDIAATLGNVAAITFDGIDWVGGYVALGITGTGPHVNPDAADNFTLNIYQNSAGVPGTLIKSVGLGGANRQATGATLGAAAEYRYSAKFAAVSLPAGRYFFGLSDAYGGTGYWGWETTSNGPLLGGAAHVGNWIALPSGNFAFDLTSSSGTASTDSSSDGPLPIWALVVLGGGLVGVASRRLKKGRVNLAI